MFKRILANLFDEVLVVAATAVLFGIVVLIMKLAGWRFTEPFYFAAIIVAIVNLFYYPIAEGKFKNTAGKYLLKID